MMNTVFIYFVVFLSLSRLQCRPCYNQKRQSEKRHTHRCINPLRVYECELCMCREKPIFQLMIIRNVIIWPCCLHDFIHRVLKFDSGMRIKWGVSLFAIAKAFNDLAFAPSAFWNWFGRAKIISIEIIHKPNTRTHTHRERGGEKERGGQTHRHR